MGFALSRTMRLEDYKELGPESAYVDRVQRMAGPRHPHQHQHRQWEYAMMVRAYRQWVWKTGKATGNMVGDFGCGVGLSPSIMLSFGNTVICYEPWVHGNEEKFQLDALASTNRAVKCGAYSMEHRPLCELVPEKDHGKFDVALCISTLEHIGEYQRAWKDLLATVKPGGLVFITTDFANDEGKLVGDQYQLAYLRAGQMPDNRYYNVLIAGGRNSRFNLLGDPDDCCDYVWGESCRLVHDYGFASLAMVRDDV